ncbi:DNA helicase [Tanacetum coccineum]
MGQLVSKFHPSYMSLQFPLLFIFELSGFHTELKLRSADGSRKAKQVTMLAYYTYQLYHRFNQYNLIYRGGRLFQQYVVDVIYCIEQNWLDFISKKHNDIRGNYLSWLYDAISRGEREGHETRQAKIQGPDDVDRFISIKLFDPNVDPCGYKIVLEMMMHGPCGVVNLGAAWHVHYQRRDSGLSTTKHQFKLDNRPPGESSESAVPLRPPVDEIQNYLEASWYVNATHRIDGSVREQNINGREKLQTPTQQSNKNSYLSMALVEPVLLPYFFRLVWLNNAFHPIRANNLGPACKYLKQTLSNDVDLLKPPAEAAKRKMLSVRSVYSNRRCTVRKKMGSIHYRLALLPSATGCRQIVVTDNERIAELNKVPALLCLCNLPIAFPIAVLEHKYIKLICTGYLDSVTQEALEEFRRFEEEMEQQLKRSCKQLL